MSDTYRASDGSLWHLSHDPPPIPYRGWDWQAWHDDYDGAPLEYGGPPGDDRAVTAPTREGVIAEIEEFIEAQE